MADAGVKQPPVDPDPSRARQTALSPSILDVDP
jgi:hypothetical protein